MFSHCTLFTSYVYIDLYMFSLVHSQHKPLHIYLEICLIYLCGIYSQVREYHNNPIWAAMHSTSALLKMIIKDLSALH